METSIIQSIISLNRNTIHNLHHTAAICKWSAKGYRKAGMSHFADDCFKEYLKTTKRIAQLVRTQRALKQELADTIENDRMMRHCHAEWDAYCAN